jgi:hypothetical protein
MRFDQRWVQRAETVLVVAVVVVTVVAYVISKL